MKKTTVKIINPVQAGFYYKNGLKPLEIVFTDRWVWVFDKESSNPLSLHWNSIKLMQVLSLSL